MNYQARFLKMILVMAITITSECVVSGQNRYNTSHLQQLAEKTGLTAELENLPDSCYLGSFKYKGHPLAVSVRNGNIEHIGYQFFNPLQRNDRFNYVYNFVERWFLSDDLGLSSGLITRAINYDIGNRDVILKCTNDSTVSISVQCFYDNRYDMIWQHGDTVLCKIVFPADYELISGLTMVEKESALVGNLSNYTHHPSETDMAPVNVNELVPGFYDPQLLMLDKDHPRTPQVANRLFYKLTPNKEAEMVYSPFYPVESTANILQSDKIPTDFIANVKLMKYNFSNEYFVMPLYDLIGYFLDEGCVPYFGLLKYEPESRELECILEMHNFHLSYEHLMKLRINLDQMADKKGNADITLTCYIPTTNFKPNETH